MQLAEKNIRFQTPLGVDEASDPGGRPLRGNGLHQRPGRQEGLYTGHERDAEYHSQSRHCQGQGCQGSQLLD